MKKFITGLVLFSVSLYSSAELTFFSEALIGQSQNKVNSFIEPASLSGNYSSTVNSTSLALRLGVKYSQHFSFEISLNDHGDFFNEFENRLPTYLPTGVCCSSQEFDSVVVAKNQIETKSARFGLKGELALTSDFVVNARIGLAYWKYGNITPQQITYFGHYPYRKESGNDIYYSLGAEYKLTEQLYLGFEYSLLSIKKSFSNEEATISGYSDHYIKDLSLLIGWQF